MRENRFNAYREKLMSGCTAELCAARVGHVLRSEYGEQRNVSKRLAVKIKTTPRAVQNWLYGVNAPRMHDLVRLMADCEALETEVLKMVAQIREGR